MVVADPLFINADAGAPEFNARELRRGFATLAYPGTDRFGARQGVRPHSGDPVTISGTTWTVQHNTAVVYPGLTAQAGPYLVQFPSESGSTAAPDGANPRIDALDLQVQDDDEDSSGQRRARVVYVSGTPGASPTAPAVTGSALRLATILVPQSGGGNPSILQLASYTVAAGGVLPLRAGEAFPTGGVYEGAYADRDGALQRRTGAGFVPVASPSSPTMLVFTSNASFVKADYPWAHRYRVRVQAAGGGGGGTGATSGSENAEAGSGGGGGYSERTGALADLPSSVAITVGSGGSGATAGANSGGAGGSSSFGSFASATGGAGGDGQGGTASNGIAAGGNGGTASGGQINIAGGDGGNGRVIIPGSGTINTIRANRGGDSHLGGGTQSSLASSSGRPGRQYGGGGVGARAAVSQSARPGASGADGVVIVELY